MKRIFVCLTTLALASVTLGQNYAKRSTTINVATGIIESDQIAGTQANHAPHVWYNLDSNRTIKPVGYDFVNPARATQFSPAIVARWTALGGAPPAVGDPINKQHAPYWELRISTATDAQLAELDIMLLAPRGIVSLNSAEREKLRRFVEKGGVLWIDVTSATGFDPWNNFPFPFLTTNAVSGTAYTDFFSPLLNFPAKITDSDLLLMQSENLVSQAVLDLGSLGFGGLAGIGEPMASDTRRFSPIAVDVRGAYLTTAQMGDGFIVVTTKGVANTLNRVPNPAGGYFANTGATSVGARSDRGSDAAAKLVLNMTSLSSGYASTLKGPRKAGSTSPDDIGAPLLQTSVDTTNPMTPASPLGYRPPAIYKGLLVVTTANQVLVYDVNPARDFDGDGNPDDGIPDYAIGASYDLIWQSNGLPGPLSSAIGIEVPNAATNIPLDQIVVTDSAGSIHAFEAFPYNANGVLQGLTAAAPAYVIAPDTGGADYDLGQPDGGPYAPVFHEGYLFNADSQTNGLNRAGRVWIANPATGRQVTTNGVGWSIGGSAASGAIQDVSFSPTVGYIPIADNSGGVDKVIYLPTRPNPSGGPQSTAGVASVWFGSKGERPAGIVDSPASLQVQTRASSQGLTVYKPTAVNDDPGLGVRLTILHPNGDPFTASEMNSMFTGAYSEANGVLTFVKNGAAPPLPVGYGVRIDYTIDYGTGVPGIAGQAVRGAFTCPDDADRRRRVLHGVALSPQGIIHVVISSQDPAGKSGGSYYAVKEEGRGSFKVLNRFDLYQPHLLTTNQANDVAYPETLQNTDQLLNYTPPFLAGRLEQQTFMSGPVISNGVVYINGVGTKGLFTLRVPYTFTMAFKAEPDVLRIQVGNINQGFSVLQPDMARSVQTSGARPDVFNVLQPLQYTYEGQRNDQGVIRIDNLSATNKGPLTNVFSTSQPIILRRNNQDDVIIEPSALGNWNQMLWYTVWMGTDTTGPNFVSGRTLYTAGQSHWAGILLGTGFNPVGQAYAMDTEVAPNSKYLRSSDPNRPWFKQQYQLLGSGGFSNIDVNPNIKWPMVQGITSFDEYRTRLQQTILTIPGNNPGTRAHGIVGGNGTVVAWADEGIWTYRRADFLVADEGRVMRFDQIGSPVWSMTGTYRSGKEGDVGGAAEVTPLVRPTRAYSIGDRQVLIVDTGANKVIRADVSGRELRTISNFKLDPNFRPAGYAANETTTLRTPRDVVTFTNIVTAANNPFSNPQAVEYWNHYVIADSGNNRLIELVDRYDFANNRIGGIVNDANGEPGIGLLYWHSPAAVSGAGFSYSSLSRTYINDGVNSRWVYAAAIGNLLPSTFDLGINTPPTSSDRKADEGNGGIVIIDGGNTKVINRVNVPAIAANVYYNDQTATFNSAAQPAREKKLGNLSSISLRTRQAGGGSEVVIMFTDGEGVFEIGQTGVDIWGVEWMLDRKAYSAMRRIGTNLTVTDNPLDFRATYAKRLESGDVLICNAYSGHYRRVLPTDPRVQFTGEVVLVNGEFDPAGTTIGFSWNKVNLGFESLSIRALLNNKPGGVRDTRGIIGPVFADKQ